MIHIHIPIHIHMPATTPPSLDPYDSRPPLQPGDEDEGQHGNYKMMVFHGSRMVFVCFLTAPGWFSWFFMIPGWFFKILGLFLLFFTVPGWFFGTFMIIFMMLISPIDAPSVRPKPNYLHCPLCYPANKEPSKRPHITQPFLNILYLGFTEQFWLSSVRE